jgi:hypothetical protein
MCTVGLFRDFSWVKGKTLVSGGPNIQIEFRNEQHSIFVKTKESLRVSNNVTKTETMIDTTIIMNEKFFSLVFLDIKYLLKH